MSDDNVHSKSEEKEIKPDEGEVTVDSDSSEQMIPKSRLDKVIEQREEERILREAKEEELRLAKEKLEQIEQSKTVSQDSDTFTKDEEDALAKIERGLKQRKFVTIEDLEEQRRIDQRNLQIKELSGKYTKGSGYPEFKTDEVMVYAKKYGYGDNLEAAYKALHFDAIVQAEAQKRIGGIEPPDSEKPVGGERTKIAGISTTQIKEMSDAEYEKAREDIMTKFKKSVTGK